MFLQDYFWFLGAIILCMILSVYASVKVNSTFNKYNSVPNSSRLSGYDTAKILLSANDVRDIKVGRVKGNLTDHYHPTKGELNLSDSTYASSSIAAVAVAAHETGHVMQHKRGYVFYKIRTALVPVVNFGSFLSIPLVLIGLLIDALSLSANPDLGFFVALIGVVLYGGSFLFALITLPVELNASKRAKKMLVAQGIISSDEVDGASAVLSAAALTYLASLLTSLVYFLRFFVRVITIFGRRK